MRRSPFYYLRHLVEAILAYTAFGAINIMPMRISSRIFSFLGPYIGFFFRRGNRVANTNLSVCFPGISIDKKREILQKMWRHFGGMMGEMPHWVKMKKGDYKRYVEVVDCYPDELFSQCIIVTAHIGNWEAFTRIAVESGSNKIIYIEKIMHNWFVHQLIKRTRKTNDSVILSNEKDQTREILRLIDQGYSIGILVDQRLDGGKLVDFFGLPAKTGMLYAKLATKFNLPIIMARCIREDSGLKYKVKFEKINVLDEYKKNPELCVRAVHTVLERWIRENPEQWLWTHRRFDIRY